MIKNKQVDKNININQIKWFDFFQKIYSTHHKTSTKTDSKSAGRVL